jgi:hypothetical protein
VFTVVLLAEVLAVVLDLEVDHLQEILMIGQLFSLGAKLIKGGGRNPGLIRGQANLAEAGTLRTRNVYLERITYEPLQG